MGDGMPYHLEKGGLLRVFESRFNDRTREEMQDLHTRLQASEETGSVDWVLGSQAWRHDAFTRSGRGSGKAQADLLEHWFGRTLTGDLPAEGERPPPYWIGYDGRVDTIVVKALRWAVELALACGSDDKTAAGLEPWPIELFWKCPSPWFEACGGEPPLGFRERGARLGHLPHAVPHRCERGPEPDRARAP